MNKNDQLTSSPTPVVEDSTMDLNVSKPKKKFGWRKARPKNMEKGRFDVVNQLVWVTPALVFVALFTVYAIFIVFRDGFNGTSIGNNFIMSIRNFKLVVADPSFAQAIGNSFLYVFISVPGSLLISLLVAKCISNVLNKRAFAFLQSLFFMPFVTSAIAVAMAFSMIFSSDTNSLFNQLMKAIGLDSVDWTRPAYAKILLLVYGLWRMLPFQIIMFTAAFTGVNKRLYHAASIDGVPKWKQFWTISIPQIMPIIIYMITTAIIGAFKFMPLGLFPNYAAAEASNVQTVVFYIFNSIRGDSINYSRAGAASIILMAIILAMTILNRFVTKWLSRKYH